MTCDWCESEVTLVTNSSLHVAVKVGGQIVEKQVPSDFPIATCSQCGETYLSLDEVLELDKLLGGEDHK